MKKPGVKWVRREPRGGSNLLALARGRVELGHGLGALGDGVLGELAGESNSEIGGLAARSSPVEIYCTS